MQLLATLAAAVRAFYNEYEDDPRGYRHLRLELRALVCRVPGSDVRVGSGGIATAIFVVLAVGGPPRPFEHYL